MSTPTPDTRKRTLAVAEAAERIAEQVEDNHWTDEQGMERLRALIAINSTDPDFFKKVEEAGRDASATR